MHGTLNSRAAAALALAAAVAAASCFGEKEIALMAAGARNTS